MFEALYSLDTQEKQTLLTSLRYIRNTSSVQCFRELFCLKTLKLWFYIFSSLSHTDVSGVAKILFCVVFPLGCQNTDKTVTIFSSIENKKKAQWQLGKFSGIIVLFGFYLFSEHRFRSGQGHRNFSFISFLSFRFRRWTSALS